MTYFASLLLFTACADKGMQNILPLGDSITEGEPYTYRHPLYNLLTDDGYDFDFVGSHTRGGTGYPESGWDSDNEGHSGWTTQSIDEELPQWLPNYSVDIALIHLGTNDAGEGKVEDSASSMTSIIEQLRAQNGSVAVCLAQILPFGEGLEEDAAELNSFVDDFNSKLTSLASELSTSSSPITIVDMNSDFSDTDLDDGVHPSQAGAEKMAAKWQNCIDSW